MFELSFCVPARLQAAFAHLVYIGSSDGHCCESGGACRAAWVRRAVYSGCGRAGWVWWRVCGGAGAGGMSQEGRDMCAGMRGNPMAGMRAHVHLWLAFARAVEIFHRSLTWLCAHDVESLGACSAMRGTAVMRHESVASVRLLCRVCPRVKIHETAKTVVLGPT